MTTAIDLFAGLGGWSTGARNAGVNVLWAANHWPVAVEWHAANHPDTQHICQDLHQADWTKVPAHDILLASPCCQGHSKARGKSSGNPQHDASRSTAWAVVSALEFHRPKIAVVENVPEFMAWALYPAWEAAMKSLGYQVAPHVVDCADLGVPQNRVRMFLICTLSKAPLMLNIRQQQHVNATSFIDMQSGKWTNIDKPGRAQATLDRVKAGRIAFGDEFVFSYYGNTRSGRSLDRPIGTITTRDRWAIVSGDKMRMLDADENLLAMTFPKGTKRPDSHRLTVHMAGNAVPPLAGQRVLEAVLAAA
ncbi:DNA cytosine methyltransferase [Pseudomonas sp. CCI3.2]|uniref:DNA cytosine methyltransferase n=1 Tax=unclassified Pseudomonas TaxID=196821 RepID=UPI002B2394AD|nr:MULTISPECIES: DNA cytosine methyltransferase [unclassified Pseudomonas]MEB0078062.1 DNA cytosine methyltransferase [Pseudomonas sp. MH10out]MEB0103178.1 DNA cytosine methyltransferase [Pseudomonas sp. CCI3.2]MEB0133414.1 DNA cytosine methyltransferase [Pseudomonas sp. CCI2.4]